MNGLEAIALEIPDPDAARAWVRDAALCDASLAQLTYVAAAATPPAITAIGAVHVCLRTADITAAHARLDAAGARFSAAPQPSHAGPSIAYFRDPAGVQYQLIEIADGPLAAGAPAPPIEDAIGTLHHVGLTVSDLDSAVAWFEAELGLATVVRVRAEGAGAASALGLTAIAYDAAVLTAGAQWLELMAFDDAGPGGHPAARLTFSDDRRRRLTGPDGLHVEIEPTREGA